MNQHINTPLVFIIFNRPELTRQVFDEIRKAEPRRLFIIADGPRSDKKQDIELCKEARAIVEHITWPCDVQRNYSETNLGCGKRVSSGIDWVFEQCDQAIILEDDCVPSSDFFTFCAEMLDKYKYDSRILSITGFSAPNQIIDVFPASYYFSRFFGMWGWATWKRAWSLYDFTLKSWPEVSKSSLLNQRIENSPIARQWERDFDNIYLNNGKRGIVDTWDFQFSFTHLYYSAFAIKPTQSLIQNIGIGDPEATHTVLAHKLSSVQAGMMKLPLTEPVEVIWNKDQDLAIFKEHYLKSEILFKIKRALKRLPFVMTLVRKILYRS